LTPYACWRTWLSRPLKMLDCTGRCPTNVPFTSLLCIHHVLVCELDLLLQTCRLETVLNFTHCTNLLPIKAVHLNPIETMTEQQPSKKTVRFQLDNTDDPQSRYPVAKQLKPHPSARRPSDSYQRIQKPRISQNLYHHKQRYCHRLLSAPVNRSPSPFTQTTTPYPHTQPCRPVPSTPALKQYLPHHPRYPQHPKILDMNSRPPAPPCCNMTKAKKALTERSWILFPTSCVRSAVGKLYGLPRGSGI
jgi:hypothetical protein